VTQLQETTKVKTKAGGDDAKGVDSPMIFKDCDDLLIGGFIGTHAEKVISGAAEDRRTLKDTTVHRRVSTIGQKSKVIEDDGFDVFLPLEAGINPSLNKAVHGNG
jgi:hypothetical protein